MALLPPRSEGTQSLHGAAVPIRSSGCLRAASTPRAVQF